MPGRGLYETLITEALEGHLGSAAQALKPQRGELEATEAADRIALNLSRVLERAINKLEPKQRVEVGAALARQLVDVIVSATAANTCSNFCGRARVRVGAEPQMAPFATSPAEAEGWARSNAG